MTHIAGRPVFMMHSDLCLSAPSATQYVEYVYDMQYVSTECHTPVGSVLELTRVLPSNRQINAA